MNLKLKAHIVKLFPIDKIYWVTRPFVLLSVCICFAACVNKSKRYDVQAIGDDKTVEYNINGTVKGVNGSKIKLYSITPDYTYTILDSVTIKDDHFSFSGNINELTPAVLSLQDSIFLSSLFLEEGNTKISTEINLQIESEGISILSSTIEGTPGNERYQAYQQKLKIIEDSELNTKKEQIMTELWMVADTVTNQNSGQYLQLSKELNVLQASIDSTINSERKIFVLENKSSPLAPYMLFSEGLGFNQDAFTLDEMQLLFNTLDRSLQNNAYYQLCRAKIERVTKLAPKESAPDFVFQYTDESDSKLTDLRGNYVLLEFWAYWCAPCMDSLTALKKLYEIDGMENFEVLTVHDYLDQEIWLETHKNQRLPWKPVIIKEGETQEVSVWELYDIGSIPTNYLIDPKGKIIGRNLSINEIKQIIKK